MAVSPSHALGQIAGYMIEEAFYDMLLPVADEFSLYPDRQGTRPARGAKKKVTWIDDHGNKHDLDFVLERGGSATKVGAPAAFIESAWRRYTKHSVNKAGEIANALVPLRRTFHFDRPFLGALVAGEWTQGGIAHMESQGINVLLLPMQSLVNAFAVEGVDFMFGEATPADHMAAQVDRWNAIGDEGQQNIIQALRRNASTEFDAFATRLRDHLSRKVESVMILPLHGLRKTAASIAEALTLLSGMSAAKPSSDDLQLLRIEIQVRYSNTDRIEASFSSLADAIGWLEQNYLDDSAPRPAAD